jgi:hypothetical protein
MEKKGMTKMWHYLHFHSLSSTILSRTHFWLYKKHRHRRRRYIVGWKKMNEKYAKVKICTK